MKERLRLIRKELRMTQAELGEATGKSRDQITSYELGRSDIDETFVLLLHEKWGYNPEWFRTGEGEKKLPRPYYEEGIELAGKAMQGDLEEAREFLAHFFDDLTPAEALLFYHAMKKRFPPKAEKD